jgi:high-affinity K+ transport system ATPase subunit B
MARLMITSILAEFPRKMAEARQDAHTAAEELKKTLAAEYASKINSNESNEEYAKVLKAQSDAV